MIAPGTRWVNAPSDHPGRIEVVVLRASGGRVCVRVVRQVGQRKRAGIRWTMPESAFVVKFRERVRGRS